MMKNLSPLADRATARKILVVDDEAIVCQSCSRIFAGRGIAIESSTSPERGLEMATANDYSAILLDIKMPGMDGIECLRKYRRHTTGTPVVMITGYSTVSSAAAAMRLGAADYIAKPFTPDEVTAAVERLLTAAGHDSIHPGEALPSGLVSRTPGHSASKQPKPRPVSPRVPRRIPSDQFLFRDEAWVRCQLDGTVRVGAFYPACLAEGIRQVMLPAVGDFVHRGLPLAQFEIPGRPALVIPAPLSGTVTAVNEVLKGDPSLLSGQSLAPGWIARLWPRDLQADWDHVSRRPVVLVTSRPEDWEPAREVWRKLGADVVVAASADSARAHLSGNVSPLVFLDAKSIGFDGPRWVRSLNQEFPPAKIVVLRDEGNEREAHYRLGKILYYSGGLLAARESADLFYDAFRPSPEAATTAGNGLSGWIARIRVRNRRGESVALFPMGRLMRNHSGTGVALIRLLLKNSFPVEVDLTEDAWSMERLLDESNRSDQSLFLQARDIGRLPGTLDRAKDALKLSAPKGNPSAIQSFTIQPSPRTQDPLGFDDRTNQALAGYLLKALAGGDE